MSYSFDELFAKTTHVREVAELVHVVTEAGSPTEAENRAKNLEYPTHLVREARLLALAKRDHGYSFDRMELPKDGAIDPWRYFDCVYGSVGQYEQNECGILAVKPHFPLPPLFWAYALYDAEGERLFSFEDSIAQNPGYAIMVNDGSNSIPAGLVMNVWPGSYLARFSFIHPITSKECVWEVNTQGWPMKSEYRRGLIHTAQVCFRPISEEDKRGIKQLIAPERYVLVISEREEKQREREDGRFSETYVIEGKYFFVSPWEDMKRFTALGGRMISSTGGYPDYAAYILSIKHGVFEGSTMRAGARPVEEVVTAMLRGMPQTIKTIETFQNLFSFKQVHLPCYNRHDAKPLVTAF